MSELRRENGSDLDINADSQLLDIDAEGEDENPPSNMDVIDDIGQTNLFTEEVTVQGELY